MFSMDSVANIQYQGWHLCHTVRRDIVIFIPPGIILLLSLSAFFVEMQRAAAIFK